MASSVSLANITQFCTYSQSSCAAPNDRALMIYRKAVAAGIIAYGDRLVITGDLDAVLNIDESDWGELVTAADEKLPPQPAQPVDEQPAAVDESKEADFTRGWNDYHAGVPWYEVELSRSRGWYAALDAELAAQPAPVKVKPRKPYRRAFALPVTMPPEEFYAVHDVDSVKLVSGVYLRVMDVSLSIAKESGHGE